MKLWPFIPEINLKETLEWKTEVLRSVNGEQRIALRFFPRTTMDMQYILDPDEYFLSSLLTKNNSLDPFLLPFWREGVSVGSLNGTETTLALDTTVRRFKDKALLLDVNDSYVVVDILSITDTELTLTQPIGTSFSNAFVVPIGQFKIMGSLDVSKGAEDYYEARARFISTEAYTYTGTISYPTHLGEYVLIDKPIANGSLKDKFEREVVQLDNGSGNIWYSPEFDYPIATTEMVWRNISPDELYSVRHFLSEMKGKQGQFWIPSWNPDFQVQQDISPTDDFIVVKDNEVRDLISDTHVAIVLKSGGYYFRKVTSIVFDSGFERLLVDPLGVTILASDIEMICTLTLMRSDSDVVKITHLPSGGSEIKIPLMEVPHGL